MTRRLSGALMAALTFGPAHANNTVQTIRFPAGKSSATRQGQIADIRIASLENNASLMIYQPPAKPVAS